MRILAISNRFPPHSIGSYELQCLQVSHELGLRGHQVRILTAESAASPINQTSAKIFRELEVYSSEDAQNGSFTRLFRKVRSNQRILEQHLVRFVPEVILFWGMEGLPLSLALTAEKTTIPCVYAVMDHWLSKACESDPWWRYWTEENAFDPPMIRNILRGLRLESAVRGQAPFGDVKALRLDNVFFCSESLKQETVKACDIPLEHSAIVPCGISPEDIRRKARHATLSGRILYVARLSDEKDPLTAIRAIQELRKRGNDGYSLDICGRGTPQYESMLHDFVRKNQLNGAISFKPLMEEQVRNALHLYDTLVFTSKYPEPFPLVHLKAMAARVPVISTLDGGSGELIRNGENGLAFETGNHYDLADQIEKISSDVALRERITDTAFDEALRYYNFERVTSHIESLLHRAIENRSYAVA